MNKSEIENFKKLFTEMKQKNSFTKIITELEESNSQDDVDLAEAEKNNQLILKLRARNYHLQNKINESLQKLEEGSFGECEDCGAQISLSRLTARPTATLCIHCKEESERTENHILYKKKSTTLGKTLRAV